MILERECETGWGEFRRREYESKNEAEWPRVWVHEDRFNPTKNGTSAYSR